MYHINLTNEEQRVLTDNFKKCLEFIRNEIVPNNNANLHIPFLSATPEERIDGTSVFNCSIDPPAMTLFLGSDATMYVGMIVDNFEMSNIIDLNDINDDPFCNWINDTYNARDIDGMKKLLIEAGVIEKSKAKFFSDEDVCRMFIDEFIVNKCEFEEIFSTAYMFEFINKWEFIKEQLLENVVQQREVFEQQKRKCLSYHFTA